MKTPKGIRPKRGKIQIRYQHNGRRHYDMLELTWTPANIEEAARIHDVKRPCLPELRPEFLTADPLRGVVVDRHGLAARVSPPQKIMARRDREHTIGLLRLAHAHRIVEILGPR